MSASDMPGDSRQGGEALASIGASASILHQHMVAFPAPLPYQLRAWLKDWRRR